MITYSPAFDLYHTIFRMVHIVQRLGNDEQMEIEKARIWDFFLLFPDKVYDITLKHREKELRDARKRFIQKDPNPYDYKGDDRRLFEWMKPVQESALSCLVACGILHKEDFLSGYLRVADKEALRDYLASVGALSDRERNTLSFMSLLSRGIPLTGVDGLKNRTELLEYKYDAQ